MNKKEKQKRKKNNITSLMLLLHILINNTYIKMVLYIVHTQHILVCTYDMKNMVMRI